MLEPGSDPAPRRPPPQVRPGCVGRGATEGNPPFPVARRCGSGGGSRRGLGRPSEPGPISGAGTNMQMARRCCRSAARRGWWGRAGGVNWANQAGAWRRGGGGAPSLLPPLPPGPALTGGPGRAAGKCRRHPSLPPTAPGVGRKPRGRPGAAAAAQLVGRGGGGFCHPGGRRRPPPPGQPRVSVSVEARGGGGASVMAKPESPRAAVSTCRRRRRSAGVRVVGGGGRGRPGRVAAAEVRGRRPGAGGRPGRPGMGRCPHVRPSPPAASPAPVMAAGSCPRLPARRPRGRDRVAEPVASDGGEGRAGRAWVGRTPPPPTLPFPA